MFRSRVRRPKARKSVKLDDVILHFVVLQSAKLIEACRLITAYFKTESWL